MWSSTYTIAMGTIPGIIISLKDPEFNSKMLCKQVATSFGWSSQSFCTFFFQLYYFPLLESGEAVTYW